MRAGLESGGRPSSNGGHHILVGLVWGALLGCAFTALLLAMVLAQSVATGVSGEPVPEGAVNLPVRPLVLAYLLGGITGGTVLGVLLRSDGGAWHWIAIGFLATLPFVVLVRVAVEGLGGLGSGAIFGLLARALALGLVLGLVLWATRPRCLTPPESESCSPE